MHETAFNIFVGTSGLLVAMMALLSLVISGSFLLEQKLIGFVCFCTVTTMLSSLAVTLWTL